MARAYGTSFFSGTPVALKRDAAQFPLNARAIQL